MAGRDDRLLVAVAVLASFVAFLDGSVVNLALPAIQAELGGGLLTQQWVLDGYLLTLGALILVAGAISDTFGRLRALRAGLVLFGLASLLCALAPSGAILIAARCLQGLGAAFLVPSSLAMLNARFTGAEQSRAIGIWTAWTGTAFVIGPLLGGLLVEGLGWRWVFAVNVVPLAVTLALSTKLADRTAARGGRVDVVGAALTAVGLGCTVFAVIEQQRLGWTNPAILAGLVVGPACLIAFVWWERHARAPMVPSGIFAARNFAVGNLATVFLYAGVSLGQVLLALFLQETGRLSPAQAGLATLPVPILSLLLAARFGELAGRQGPRRFMAAGPLIAAAGFVLMAVTTGNVWVQTLPGLVLFGIGLAVTVSPLTAAILAAVQPVHSGIGSAINNAVARVSGLIAIAFTAVIVGGAIDLDGFRRGVIATAVLLVIAAVVSAVGIDDRVPDLSAPSQAAVAACQDRDGPPPAAR
ncbi:EmrB/QacA subfamily drug resistance transporter [Mycolicibacterium sp. BK556]|uniref:MFS transporter n=1 Tax=unclassified Mycolicibacterium TaxID=2636767 RepID=UPI00160F40EA|nr:EmrB/QacA subfamily drug resistance transporter [Mycolicibacterium sp. BK556]MBB3634769.1 EmrB/QacA subfamily drug resistance transporter [Mycolicibacterium sp. BK607]